MKNIDTSLFKSFVDDVKQKIKAAQYKALQAVNKEQIALYWDIGQLIVERQEQYGWGKSIVENLAKELQADFSDTKGFSAQNLWYMRQFFTEYSKSELLQPLVGEINWTKHLIIIAKCKDEHQRFFYLEMTRRHLWSKSALIQAIEGKMWEKTVINQQNFSETLPNQQGENAALVLKDEYTFDFLDLSEPYTEQQLELALLSNIRNFLASMGGDFAFIGNQFGVKVDGKNYEIDLLLYHRALQCLVAIDLKIDDFKPEYVGKMNFYLSALNKYHRKPHENSSIGIIICKNKHRTVVEFALQDVQKPIGVATYTLTESLPQELSQFFPTSQEFIDRIEEITDKLKGN